MLVLWYGIHLFWHSRFHVYSTSTGGEQVEDESSYETKDRTGPKGRPA